MNHIIDTFPKYRKHTLCFLDHARNNSPVSINVEVDMTNIFNIRLNNTRHKKYSYITYLIYIISRVLTNNPKANSSFMPGILPKMIFYKSVYAKFIVDKIISGSRAIVSAVIPNSYKLTLEEIQSEVNYYKYNEFHSDKKYYAIRILHKLPLFIGKFLFGLFMNNAAKSAELQGSFTVTSLGHYPIDNFIPISSSTLTFGVGQVRKKAVVIEDLVEIKPMMTLTMVFDHRAIDGAEAAKILIQIKNSLEHFIDDEEKVYA